uniref:Uncharacterized protein n=1 Tax=Anguilla anguilla TaxID=7936 RepID=A0A0E9S316_ANGAN
MFVQLMPALLWVYEKHILHKFCSEIRYFILLHCRRNDTSFEYQAHSTSFGQTCDWICRFNIY